MNYNPVSRKGRPSKRMIDKLMALAERDLAKEILDHIANVEDPATQASLKLKLMEFIIPKRKAVEMDAYVEINEEKEAAEVRALAEKLVVIKSDVA